MRQQIVPTGILSSYTVKEENIISRISTNSVNYRYMTAHLRTKLTEVLHLRKNYIAIELVRVFDREERTVEHLDYAETIFVDGRECDTVDGALSR